MSDDRREEEFFAAGGTSAPIPPPPGRRESPLLRRSPLFAAVALAVCGWLLWDLWPETAWFFTPRTPVDLGGPGAYRLDLARENRLATIRGELVDAVPVTDARTHQQRTVGRVAGTSVVVDRPGRGGPPVFEGRILPRGKRADYDGAIAAMRAHGGGPAGASYVVLRDGERPRSAAQAWPVGASALLVLLVAVNLRALLKRRPA